MTDTYDDRIVRDSVQCLIEFTCAITRDITNSSKVFGIYHINLHLKYKV